MAIAVNQLILIIVAGVLAARAGRRLRIPESIPLLITGYILGGDLLGVWKPNLLGIDLGFLSIIAIPVILYYGGLKTDAKNIASKWRTILSVTTIAVFITVIGIATLSYYLLNLPLNLSLLLGAILSSTDAAAILPVIRNLNINKKVSTLISAEAVLNDATAITLFTSLFGLASGSEISLKIAISQFLYYLIASSAVGILVGIVANEVFKKLKISGELTFASLIVMLTAYGLAQAISVSSVIAVVLSALVFRYFLQSGQVDPLERLNTLSAWESLSFLALAIIFLVLGGELRIATILPYLLAGTLISFLFILIVRPLSVIASMWFDKSYNLKEMLFISFAGSPRGAVSAALASVVLVESAGAGLSNIQATTIFSVTIIVILITIAIASLFASTVAKYLLGASENSVESRYRLLSTQLKSMNIASRRMREDWKIGLIPSITYDEISKEYSKQMESIELELTSLTTKSPYLKSRERAIHIKELLMNQIASLDQSYENKEISQDDYEELSRQFRSQIQTLTDLEDKDTQIIQQRNEKQN